MTSFNPQVYHTVKVPIADPHNRHSVQLHPQPGQVHAEQVWAELCQADQDNFIMCAFTFKDGDSTSGLGASGEHIGSNGIVKGHAYSLISAREVTADGRIWKVLQVRNPWGANPAAEWKGALCDNWSQWPYYPELQQSLEIGSAELDGMFWMTWDDFGACFSDVGVVPRQMEVPRLGAVEGIVKAAGSKHLKKYRKQPVPTAASVALAEQVLPPRPQLASQFAAVEPLGQAATSDWSKYDQLEDMPLRD